MYARTLIFVLRALQNQLQIQILHKILIYFKKKIIKNASFFAILQHFSVPVLVACTLSNAWNPLCVVQIGRRTYPPRAISHFFNISCEIPRMEGWNSSYIERGKWNAQGPRGGYVRRQIWTKHYTFQKILSRENFLEMFKISQLLKKKVFQKIAFFLGQFPKKCLREVLATRPKSGVKSWKVMRFWWFFFKLDQKFDVESDCEVKFVQHGEEM